MLLKDDLTRGGPYKRDPRGNPTNKSLVTLHAIIFKHSQKKIIEREMELQQTRMPLFKEQKWAEYKETVRKGTLEMDQISKYVAKRALEIVNLTQDKYYSAFSNYIMQPNILNRLQKQDEVYRC